jgi:hypothetical protein
MIVFFYTIYTCHQPENLILKKNKKQLSLELGMVVHAYNPSTQETEAGGSQI